MTNAPVKTIFKIPQDKINTLIIFYLIAHGGAFFILNAVYWDDWTLFNAERSMIIDTFKMNGSMFNASGYLHILLQSIGPWIYRILTIGLMFFSGILIYTILVNNKWFNKESSFYVALLFLVGPFFIARVSMIVFPYTFCLFLFLLGWYYLNKNKMLAGILFLISFNTQSLLVFYSIPIFFDYYEHNNTLDKKLVINYGLKKLVFLLLPFFWFFIKITFFKPTIFFDGYNQNYDLINLMIVPFQMARDFMKLNINLSLLIFCIALVTFIGRKFIISNLKNYNRIIFIGFISLIMGLFPYFILGHIPTFHGWLSRHQLLLMFPVSLIIVGLLYKVKTQYRFIILHTILGISITKNINDYTDFYFDWKKQKEIISFVSNEKAKINRDLVLFNDKTETAINRHYRFYEWNGLLKYAVGDESNFGINLDEYGPYQSGIFDKYFSKYFNAETHINDPEKKPIQITIDYFGSKNNLKRIFEDLFNKKTKIFKITMN